MVKVISVGNITMGGTGKTPHTILIANYLIANGERVTILSRGYKGKIGLDTNVISDGKKIYLEPPLASDEPYMIALNCPEVSVITGKNRKKSLEYAIKNFNPTIALLDDGFQYKGLKKDINILLLDHKKPISTGFPFPFGYLREFPSAIKKADIIIFTRAINNIIPKDVKKYIKNKFIFFSKTIFTDIILNNKTIPLRSLKGVKVGIYSAIANNSSFFTNINDSGLNIVYSKGFQDHALLKDDIVNTIVKNSFESGAKYILTTEKDYVKLNNKYKEQIAYLKMNIKINNQESFFKLLK